MAEQVERLGSEYEIHVYSNRVADVDLSRVTWHRVPALPGPHLFAYCWWVLANHLQRWRDARFRNMLSELVYSPGINCFDADVISVHMVFSEYRERMRPTLALGANPLGWPRRLHRRLYYGLLAALEKSVYTGNGALLTAVSAKAADDLKRYGRAPSQVPVIPHGIDVQRFHPDNRRSLRESARRELVLDGGDFCLLLIGNDWMNKGLDCLLKALVRLPSSVRLFAVGSDDIDPYRAAASRLQGRNRVRFLAPRADVEFYYAAADLYVGPSLQDAFGLPPLEAMACGVPAIVSSQAGVSEIITHGTDGFILDDPRDSARLAELIDLLHRNDNLRKRMSEAAAQTARKYTWERNAQQLGHLFKQVLRRKGIARPQACMERDQAEEAAI